MRGRKGPLSAVAGGSLTIHTLAWALVFDIRPHGRKIDRRETPVSFASTAELRSSIPVLVVIFIDGLLSSKKQCRRRPEVSGRFKTPDCGVSPEKRARCTYVMRGMRRRKRMHRDGKRLCSLRDGNLLAAAMGRCIAAAITMYVSKQASNCIVTVYRPCLVTTGTESNATTFSLEAREQLQVAHSGVTPSIQQS
jgi:hypothetical protein